jgi:hypothetical protein
LLLWLLAAAAAANVAAAAVGAGRLPPSVHLCVCCRYITEALAAERAATKSASGACAAICNSGSLLRLLFIGSFLQFTQQIAGINTIMCVMHVEWRIVFVCMHACMHA